MLACLLARSLVKKNKQMFSSRIFFLLWIILEFDVTSSVSKYSNVEVVLVRMEFDETLELDNIFYI